ncbi:unnamed protein product [Ectocarpus sp. CCAP 1310/34]|nr:unnamed protein product [Ectocarpus sp. CCAP 1310/34]
MSDLASMTPSLPLAKRRCWDLIITGASSNAEDDIKALASFRKRYTSARKIEFKPTPTATNAVAVNTAATTTFNNTTDTGVAETTNRGDDDGFTTNTKRRKVCIQVEFSGPQPIKGPAELMCSLLSGSSVSALPVFLARGRRRKKSRTSCASDERAEEEAAVTDHVDPRINTLVESALGRNDNCGDGEAHATVMTVEGEETAAAAAAAVAAALSGAAGQKPPLRPPAFSVAADDLIKWNDLIPHLDGDTPHRRRSTQDLSSMSPSSSVGGFSSSATLLSDCDEYSCDANMSSRESAAQLFKDADKAIAECYFGPVDTDGMLDLAGEASPVDFDADVKSELFEFPSRVDEGDDGGDVNASINSCSTKIEQNPASTPVHTKSESPVFDVAGQASPASADSAAANQGKEEEEESWEWFDSEGNARGSQEGNVAFGLLRQECDFDGRSAAAVPAASATSASANGVCASSSTKKPCRLRFKGIEGVDYGIRDLAVTAQFSVGPPGNLVGTAPTNLEADRNACAGSSSCTITYPSMEDIWPEVYSARSVKVVEVDMTVDVRSSDGKWVHSWPSVKVMYRRARTATTPQVQRCVKVPPFHALPDPFDRSPRALEPANFVGAGSSHSMLIPEALHRPSSPTDGPPEESFAALLI